MAVAMESGMMKAAKTSSKNVTQTLLFFWRYCFQILNLEPEGRITKEGRNQISPTFEENHCKLLVQKNPSVQLVILLATVSRALFSASNDKDVWKEKTACFAIYTMHQTSQ